MHMDIAESAGFTARGRGAAAQGWWHELNCRDVRAAVQFYGRALGWRFDEIMLADGSSYRIARDKGRAVCGLFEIVPELHGDVPDHWMTYVNVQDMEAALRAVRFAGGEILRMPVTVPGLGQLALVADVAGAIIGLMQAESWQRLHAAHRGEHAVGGDEATSGRLLQE